MEMVGKILLLVLSMVGIMFVHILVPSRFLGYDALEETYIYVEPSPGHPHFDPIKLKDVPSLPATAKPTNPAKPAKPAEHQLDGQNSSRINSKKDGNNGKVDAEEDVINKKGTEETAPLRKCRLYEDTYGAWVATEEVTNTNASFYGGDGPGYALLYDKIWIPHGCAYHRFTNATLHQCAAYQLAKRRDQKNATNTLIKSKKMKKKSNFHDSVFEINLMGDSALRGITCGITRILTGNEYEGPCDNVVCGGTGYLHPLSAGNAFGHPFSITFASIVKITFTYVKTFVFQHFDWLLEWEVEVNQPNVLVMNTGAWDFDTIAREMETRGVIATDKCMYPNQTQVSHQRASQFVNDTIVHELGGIATENDVRLIYRGNHFNKRFGPSCADDELVGMLRAPDSAWEVWDNMNISRDVWQQQTWDGFHFDRHQIHSVEQHLYNVADWKSKGRETPGALEMQFAQSLLNAIFHDCLMEQF